MGCKSAGNYTPPTVINDLELRLTIDEFTMQFDDNAGGGVEPARYTAMTRLLRLGGVSDIMRDAVVDDGSLNPETVPSPIITHSGFLSWAGEPDFTGFVAGYTESAEVVLDARFPISPTALRTAGAQCFCSDDGMVWRQLVRSNYTTIPDIDGEGNPLTGDELEFATGFAPSEAYQTFGALMPWGSDPYNPFIEQSWGEVDTSWTQGLATLQGWLNNDLLFPLYRLETAQFWRFKFVNSLHSGNPEGEFRVLGVAGLQVFL